MSIVALATDIMLPALGAIADDLGVADGNAVQLVVSSLFLGFAVGQALAGPLSDSFGRRPVILWGYGLFVIGSVICLTSSSFEWMIVGDLLPSRFHSVR